MVVILGGGISNMIEEYEWLYRSMIEAIGEYLCVCGEQFGILYCK